MPNSKKTWVLVTDVSKARIYAMHRAKFLSEPKRENFEFLAEYTHEQSREANHDLVSDKAGLYATRLYRSSNASNFEPQTMPKEHEADVFATELVRHLELARSETKFKDLIIIAPSAFMGLLNKHMSVDLNRLVAQRFEKDYAHLNESELVQMLYNNF